eukprot:gene24324-31128_t
MSSFSYSSRLDPALSYEQFSGDKLKQPRKVWDDPAAQKLIDESFVESDTKKRQVLFDQLHAMMLTKVPMIMLYNVTDSWAVRKRITGFTGVGAFINSWAARLDRFVADFDFFQRVAAACYPATHPVVVRVLTTHQALLVPQAL